MPRQAVANRVAESGRVAVSGRVASTRVAWYLNGGAPTPVAVYQPLGAASLAASYVNLVNPGTFNAAPGVAPTFASATGWTFNGTTQYLVTGVVPGDAWSMLVQFNNVPATNVARTLIGVNNTSNLKRFNIQPTAGSSNVVYEHQGTLGVSPRLLAGNLGIAGQQGYRDGVADGVAIGTSIGSYVQDLYIGSRNNIGVADRLCQCDIYAIAIYNSALTAAQMLAVSAAMAAL